MRIFATKQEPDFELPWQARPLKSASGSGVIIAPGRVLTGAHVVANATFLQVQKVSEPTKFVAHVASICHDSDLALLAIDDPTFPIGAEPARLGGLPQLRERIAVVGYPVGGEEISITEGIVSRIEVQRYTHSQQEILAVTVDAAINPGNSGGPAFKDGRVVGVAFQGLDNAENIGDLVPSPVIRTFLAGAGEQHTLELPALSITTQNLENPRLRQRVGMSDGATGVLVNRVEFGGAAWGHLKPGDVLLSIAAHSIANNGTIRYLKAYRTRFNAVLADHQVGEPISLVVLRDGVQQTVRFPLKPRRTLLGPSQYDTLPRYFIFAGMVFQPLTRNLLETWDNWEDTAPPELVHAYYAGARTAERQEVVVMTEVLADDINVGYEPFANDSIVAINGVRPRDMDDFVARIEAAEETVELETSTDALMVFDVREARAAIGRILKRYRVPADRSPDLGSKTTT